MILAGVTALVGLIWQLNNSVATLAADQTNVSASITARTQDVNSRLSQIRQSNQEQNQLIGHVRDLARDNHSELQMLKSRITALENRGQHDK
jgi:uncharacterized protein YfcZ (UPF0381/DUF406 family)